MPTSPVRSFIGAEPSSDRFPGPLTLAIPPDSAKNSEIPLPGGPYQSRAMRTDIANTMTVYEFNQAGKLRHLDVYLQHEM